MHKEISSFQNPLIKHCVLLQEKSRERKKSGQFLIEGKREIGLALKGGYHLDTVLFSTNIISEEELFTLKKQVNTDAEFIEISADIYEKLGYRGSTEGVLAIAKAKNLSLEKLQFKNENPLILVAEAPEKPGNIGAILRTADAANLDAVIIANPKTDMYNPNIIRSSVGGIFTNEIAMGSTKEIIEFLKLNKVSIYCAALEASTNYINCEFKTAAAIVVGTEDSGLTDEWLNNSKKNIIIPMLGKLDSMNVSVAAGVLIFEARRQRNFQ